MSKVDDKFAGDQLILSMVSEDCPCAFYVPDTIEKCYQQIEAIKEANAECINMELDQKDIGNEEEVAFWRGQQSKNDAMLHILHKRIKELGRLQKGYAIA